MADRGLAAPYRPGEVAGAHLVGVGDDRQQPQPHRIGQHLEGRGQLLGLALAEHGAVDRAAARLDDLQLHRLAPDRQPVTDYILTYVDACRMMRTATVRRSSIRRRRYRKAQESPCPESSSPSTCPTSTPPSPSTRSCSPPSRPSGGRATPTSPSTSRR